MTHDQIIDRLSTATATDKAFKLQAMCLNRALHLARKLGNRHRAEEIEAELEDHLNSLD